ncbi:hypothetical protein SOMG_01161 [Schizosaccharomyces osmophilus]|uniref:Uncharacterized protein n=1 Tax=Schizosaccharomyces osmophilus TaxID=2545709 RepID=A0AAE9W9C7_9SCHI|nr:uncharacterized protein SOMG_01161 [Schizosaccharomyces osmophilus]WBW72075.1 hypothetical protein SOMG_01161 [Schizosaccharomyces osmophilus]
MDSSAKELMNPPAYNQGNASELDLESQSLLRNPKDMNDHSKGKVCKVNKKAMPTIPELVCFDASSSDYRSKLLGLKNYFLPRKILISSELELLFATAFVSFMIIMMISFLYGFRSFFQDLSLQYSEECTLAIVLEIVIGFFIWMLECVLMEFQLYVAGTLSILVIFIGQIIACIVLGSVFSIIGMVLAIGTACIGADEDEDSVQAGFRDQMWEYYGAFFNNKFYPCLDFVYFGTVFVVSMLFDSLIKFYSLKVERSDEFFDLSTSFRRQQENDELVSPSCRMDK